MPKLGTSRKQGIEWRALKTGATYVISHPRTLAASSTLAASTMYVGPYTTGGILGGLALGGISLSRCAPKTWDSYFQPHIAAWWRRWRVYQRKWEKTLNACDLVKFDRLTGEIRIPRLKSVRTRGWWDVLTVKMAPGQKAQKFRDVAEELANAFHVKRIEIEDGKPQHVHLIVERGDPFGGDAPMVPPTPIPEVSSDVSLTAVDVGAGEDGDPFFVKMEGNHILLTGVTRSGKSGLIWNPLRDLAPMIHEGLVRVHASDLKGGVEMDPGMPLYTSYSRTADGCLMMLKDLVEWMKSRQRQISEAGRRKFCLSEDEPFHLIMIDEMLVMSQFLEPRKYKEFSTLIGQILTQGAGLGFCVVGMVQDPTTEAVPMRKLFPTKIALRLDSENHVDMVLGEGKRMLGGFADLIPENQKGVGYAVVDGKREPRRFRFGSIDDDDIKELLEWAPHTNGPALYDTAETEAA